MSDLDFTTSARSLNTNFIGREYAFKKIKKLWSIPTGIPRSMLLWGDHCIGKSTVLWNASKNLQGTSVAYTSLQRLGRDRETKYVWLALADALEEVDSIVFVEDDIFLRDSHTVFSEYVEQFLIRHPEHKLLLAIDEYEVFLDILESATIFKQLEELTLKHNRLAFLLCGGHDSSRVNIGFNPTYKFLLGFFTKEETVQFVGQQPYKFDPDATDRLYELTRGQPWLVRGLCFNIIGEFNEIARESGETPDTVTVSDVEKIASSDRFYENYRLFFGNLYSCCESIACSSTTLQEVLVELANDLDGDTVYGVARYIHKEPEQVREVIQKAMEYHPGSLIAKQWDDDCRVENYRVAIELFRRWIFRTQK